MDKVQLGPCNSNQNTKQKAKKKKKVTLEGRKILS